MAGKPNWRLSSYLGRSPKVLAFAHPRPPRTAADLVEKILDVGGPEKAPASGPWSAPWEMGIAVPTILCGAQWAGVMSSLHGERQSASSVDEAPPAPPKRPILGALGRWAAAALRDAVILACIRQLCPGMA